MGGFQMRELSSESMAELGLGHRMQGGAQRVVWTHSWVLGVLLGCGVVCGAATAGGVFWVATALWASAVKCNPLKWKNTLMMLPFCSMSYPIDCSRRLYRK